MGCLEDRARFVNISIENEKAVTLLRAKIKARVVIKGIEVRAPGLNARRSEQASLYDRPLSSKSSTNLNPASHHFCL